MFTPFASSEKVIEKARRLLEKGKDERAVQVFEGPLKKDPRNVELLLGLAGVFCEIQDTQAAVREYRKAFKANPDKAPEILSCLNNPPGRANRTDFSELSVEILIHQRDLAAATKGLAEMDDTTLSKILDRTRTRIAELRKISTAGHNARLMADLGYLMGLILEHQKSYGPAFSAFSSVLEVREEELLTLLPHLEEVVQHVRNEAGPFLFMGDLLRKPEPKKSAAFYDMALRVDPKTASAVIDRFKESAKETGECWVLGRAYLTAGAWAEAAASLEKIQEEAFRPRIIELLKGLDPAQAGAEPAVLLLGDQLLASGDCDDASKIYAVLSGRMEASLLEERFRRLLEIDPENLNAARALGALCLNEGDLKSSMAQMRKIFHSDPSQGEELFAQSLLLVQDHFEDPELSCFLAELCLNCEEEDRPVVFLRRFVQLSPAEADRALPMYQKLIQEHPSHPVIRIGQAEALMALGRYDEAFQFLEVALTLDQSLLHDLLWNLSLLVRKHPALSAKVLSLFRDLQKKGTSDPAVDMVWAEAALAAGDYRDAVARIIRCAVRVPDKAPVVEAVMEDWQKSLPDEVEIRLGAARLSFNTGKDADLAAILDPYLCDHPGAADKVIAFYKEALGQRPGNLSLCQGLLSAYLHSGTFDLVMVEGKKLEKVLRPPQIAVIHRIMGDACKEMGRFTEAVSLFYQVFREDPSSAETIARRLEEILAINPSLPKASLALGAVLSACGKVKDAVDRLLHLVRDLPESRETVLKYLIHISAKHPLHQEPILGMAELHVLDGKYEAALELLWKAIQRDAPDSDTILRLLDRIVRKNPGMARVHLETGRVYSKTGRYSKAANSFLRAVEMEPALSEQAIKFCHDIIAQDPSEITVYEVAAQILVRMRRQAAAVSFLSSAGDSHPEIREALLPRMEEIAGSGPETPDILKDLAWAYLKVGRIGPAVTSMQKAFAMDPSYAREGERLFNAVIDQVPDQAETRMARGRCRLNNLDFEGAFEDVRCAVRSDPEKIDEGIEILERLEDKGSHGAEFYLFMGGLFARKGAHKKAIHILEAGLKTVTEDRERLPLMLQLAETHEATGDLDAARAILRDARDRTSDQGFYYQKLNEFSVQGILFETRALEQEASRGAVLPGDKLKRLITHLVLLGREDDARERVREQTRSRDAEGSREIWGHFYEETGNYALSVQCGRNGDVLHRVRLLEQAGELMLAASVLEEAVKADPASVLYEHLKSSWATLMEESLLQERHPLMGETRLTISTESSGKGETTSERMGCP